MLLEETAAPSRFAGKTRHWIIAIVLAAALLYLSLKGIQWREVWRTIAHARAAFVALSVLIGIVALFARALRWRVLLSSRAAVNIATAFWGTVAGYFGNTFLPARAGELIRTFFVSSRTGLAKMFVLTTALSERMSDAIALALISSVVLLTLSRRPGWFAHAAKPFASISAAGVLAIILLPLFEGFWVRILNQIPFSIALREKAVHLLEHVLAGVRAFHDRGRLFRFSALTLFIWLLDAVSTVVLMRSLGMYATLSMAFLLVTSLALGSALPATPGYIGIYQFVAVSVLVPFGFSRTDAIAYILTAQAINYVGIAIWGLLAFSQARIPNWRDTVRSGRSLT